MVVAIALASLWPPTTAAGQVLVYSNDFQGAVGAEWSSTSTATTPVGNRQFLGQFATQTVSLSLGPGSPVLPAGLPAHDVLNVSFQVFVIRSWDGNSTDSEGPDTWNVGLRDGPTLMNTTFNNGAAFHAAFGQAYPGTYPGNTVPPRTGASENDTLGYVFTSIDHDGPMDAVYNVSLTTPHTGPAAVIDFAAVLLTGGVPGDILNESWGLDNVVVSVTPVPEPAVSLLSLAGTLGLLWRLRRRHNARSA
jgi:hypothetical protein